MWNNCTENISTEHTEVTLMCTASLARWLQKCFALFPHPRQNISISFRFVSFILSSICVCLLLMMLYMIAFVCAQCCLIFFFFVFFCWCLHCTHRILCFRWTWIHLTETESSQPYMRVVQQTHFTGFAANWIGCETISLYSAICRNNTFVWRR